ncbi:MAG TPA: anti-sigma regulatory factor [Stellaceae bacterium]|nr:anti-sigma regulatory factor [Stellaceae bacterium]
MTSDGELIVPIRADVDILLARQKARALVMPLRFSTSELTVIATAISEVARNIVSYAGQGEVELAIVQQGARRGLRVIARDHGPGIADIERAMQDGFSTSRSLGLGLPGSKRLMDEFQIASQIGEGTVVTMIKWEH